MFLKIHRSRTFSQLCVFECGVAAVSPPAVLANAAPELPPCLGLCFKAKLLPWLDVELWKMQLHPQEVVWALCTWTEAKKAKQKSQKPATYTEHGIISPFILTHSPFSLSCPTSPNDPSQSRTT